MVVDREKAMVRRFHHECNTIREMSQMKKEKIAGWMFALPAILGFVLLTGGPMVVSLILSFTDYHVAAPPEWIGADNYINLLSGKDPFFYKSLFVTVYYVILSVPLQMLFSFFMALVLNRKIKGRGIFRAIFYMPTVIPSVAISTIWLWLLNPDMGLINNILRSLHLPTSLWIYSEKTVIPSLAMMSVWVSGASMVIFLAGLQGIPSHLYEAVEIDGGNAFHKFKYITLPMMTPTIFFNTVMAIINGFQEFTSVFVMTNGGPNDSSLMLAFYLYREAFKFQKMGNASAVAWLIFLIIGVLTLIMFRSSNHWVYYEDGREGDK